MCTHQAHFGFDLKIQKKRQNGHIEKNAVCAVLVHILRQLLWPQIALYHSYNIYFLSALFLLVKKLWNFEKVEIFSGKTLTNFLWKKLNFPPFFGGGVISPKIF